MWIFNVVSRVSTPKVHCSIDSRGIENVLSPVCTVHDTFMLHLAASLEQYAHNVANGLVRVGPDSIASNSIFAWLSERCQKALTQVITHHRDQF